MKILSAFMLALVGAVTLSAQATGGLSIGDGPGPGGPIKIYGKVEPPTLTETDKLRVQVIQLMQQLSAAQKDANECRGQLAGPLAELNKQQIEQAVKDAKAAIDQAHDGYEWNPTTGDLTKKAPVK